MVSTVASASSLVAVADNDVVDGDGDVDVAAEEDEEEGEVVELRGLIGGSTDS